MAVPSMFSWHNLSTVMAGLGPATHDFGMAPAESWMPGPSPGRTRGEGEAHETAAQSIDEAPHAL
jgi:hypothetical protein